ncbi:PRAME family member 12-like [Peromyscus leucopus]|uniref:PRAME family member 12-like n=1 Tax=Peromyscus leucopus TaxID=10041 RepID=UPI0010A120B5|nr:PRAME family member 12-like [Peromyscus leucopus]
MKSLLRNEALAISVLHQLPSEFFPSLFKEAFRSRHMKILTAMVAEWPFSCLPVGALMQAPDVVILQAVLDGVRHAVERAGSPEKVEASSPGPEKKCHVFWDVWPGIECGETSTGTLSKEQKENDLPRYALRQRLKVVTPLYLAVHPYEEQAYLLQWAQQQQGAVQLCCLKMIINNTPEQLFMMVFNTFKPYYIEELHLSVWWSPRVLSHFAYCFGQMRNLRKLHLHRITIYTYREVYTLEDIEKYTTRFFAQISKLRCLQDFLINDLDFCNEHMKQFFRCLKSPLESLSIKLHKFSPSDWKYLSQSLQVLLKSVADTLQTLQISNCCIRDSEHGTLLPALSQCLQLSSVNFYDTAISMSALKDLLQSLANLSKLTEEHYPAPLECYDDQGHVLVNKFANVCLDLLNTIRVRRQPKVIDFATKSCSKCSQRCVFDRKPRLCPCLL